MLVAILVLVGLFFVLRPGPSGGEAQKRSMEVEISDGAMIPGEISVGQGDRVTLNLTADRPVELHVHGYDLEKEVEPGEATRVYFRADQTGRFPVEDHETEAELGVLVVEPR